MGVIEDLALAGVDRVERSLGKKAALRTLAPLIDTLPAGSGRARAILRAVGYAAELGDDAQLESLCARWIADGDRALDARRLVVRLAGEGRARAAAELAEAEVLRTVGQYDEGAARYALGRCLEELGRREEALLEHEAAARLASEQPLLRALAGARAARVLFALGREDEAAARAAGLLPLERGAPEDRLAVAVIALGSPGRYRRAAALDVLELLARQGGEAGEAALRWAAWHAERAGLALSEIEADRIEAIVAPRSEAAAVRARELAALAGGAPGALAHAASGDAAAAAILPRAKAVMEGGAAGPRPDGGRALTAWLALAACASARSSDRVSARERLAELASRVRAGARLEAPAWTAAILALREPRLSEVGIELVTALLARSGEPPPRGFVALAEALEAAGSELAIPALRRAAARREPGARDRLARILGHRGWAAADAGRRAEALALLREARRLAS